MATLFYVTPTGSDSNIGTTIGASFKTIQRAIEASTSSGDWNETTIKVYPSASSGATYHEGLNSSSPYRQGLTIEAITDNGVVYLDVGGESYGFLMGYYNTLRNFYVTGGTGHADCPSNDTIKGTSAGQPMRVEDCIFDNCTRTNRTVVTATDRSHPFQDDAGHSWVKRCTFKNLDCTRAILNPVAGHTEIESILIYDSTFDYEAIFVYGASEADGTEPAAGERGTVLENITVDGCTTGRDVIGMGQRAFARNCIVSNCDAGTSSPAYYRLYRSSNTSSYTFPDGKTFFNCIAYNNERTAGNLFYPDEQTSSCFVNQAPGYSNRSGKDFSLTSTSIALGAGTALASASFDINSASYIQYSSPIPIGAFQNPAVAAAGDSSLNINVLASTFTMNGSSITVN